ncbi:hypothetical protein C0Q70_10754 [Pomacea canaliculata]|uniref:PDZ domain-containing protein n=1 Tax=Pomacea canaliculata TaxID=400727 RepID=A0A2T7P426_POMCA|nr:hypothetical protein C0Q70_10754 [Pomacea canaliculata]
MLQRDESVDEYSPHPPTDPHHHHQARLFRYKWREASMHGFGFSLVEEFPVRVGRVDLASPAEKAGLKVGDFIVKVNNQNVSRSTVASVAKLVKMSGASLLLQLQRPRQVQTDALEQTPWKKTDSIYESIAEEAVGQQDPHVCPEGICDYCEEEEELSADYDMTAPYAPFPVGKFQQAPLCQI